MSDTPNTANQTVQLMTAEEMRLRGFGQGQGPELTIPTGDDAEETPRVPALKYPWIVEMELYGFTDDGNDDTGGIL